MFTPFHTKLCLVGTTEINTIWDLEPLKPLAYLPKSYVSSLSIYNKTLVTGSLDGVGMYDLNSYKCVKKFNYPTGIYKALQ